MIPLKLYLPKSVLRRLKKLRDRRDMPHPYRYETATEHVHKAVVEYLNKLDELYPNQTT